MQAQWTAAEKIYSDVLRQNPGDFDANHMLGVIALQTGRAGRGVELISTAVRLNPAHAQAFANLGSAFLLDNRADDAIEAYQRALQLDPCLVGALSNLATCLQRLNRHDEAAAGFERLLALAPAADFASGDLFHARRCGADWRNYQETLDAILAEVALGKSVDRPFSILSASAAAATQLRCARIQAAHYARKAGPPVWRGERYGHDRIRLAYVSADFRGHVVLNLMNAIFERHDLQRFSAIGVSLSPKDDSELSRQARSTLEESIDASSLSDLDVARLLRAKEIDIAVDLTGYTLGGRTAIFAWRPAPIQVNFLGFPGTMGAAFIDYIIADHFVVPPPSRAHYDEHVVRLPGTFQANGPHTAASLHAVTFSRSSLGLPETSVVLCSFNNTYKLNPMMFDSWARILRSVPACVLWLLADQSRTRDRLRAEAAARGIAADQIVFAPRLPYAQHLARLAAADLFLDTLPFNAGATASDALRAGVPVLTCAGDSFASRMAGSLLTAAGLPELIALDLGDYEGLAIDLARNPARLAEFRSRLIRTSMDGALFDPGRYCANLELAYTRMWTLAERGEPPTDIDIEN